jgi:hypothetical protein
MKRKLIIEMAQEAGFELPWSIKDQEKLERFANLVAAAEREAIAQMFEDAPALVPFAQNDKGGCMVCGFTPKLAIEAIRARGDHAP